MTSWWSSRTPGQRVVLLVLGAILAINIGIAALGSIVDSDPGGPTSSPRTTDGSGLAAYVQLLRDRGRSVEVITDDLTGGELPADATVLLVDPLRFGPDDGRVLSEFLDAGGRLVLAGPTTSDLLPSRTGADTVSEGAPPGIGIEVIGTDELTGSARTLTGGGRRWRNIGDFRPLAGTPERPFLVAGEVGDGQLVALADAGPLRNRHLARADNAALGVALAGDRPVVFLDRTTETDVTGLAAVPTSWKWTAAALAVTGAFLLWSLGTRFGPPEPDRRELRPARLVHVEAVAAGITRQRPGPDVATERIRSRERAALVDELRLDPSVSDAVLTAEAQRLDVDPERITAILHRPTTVDEALTLGRIAARRTHDRRRSASPPDTETTARSPVDHDHHPHPHEPTPGDHP